MDICFTLRSTRQTHTISLPTAMVPFSNGQNGEVVVSSALRSPRYAKFVSLPLLGAELREESEFKADFQLVLDALNATNMPFTTAVMKQALLRVCNNHVSQYGRIWIADAMMYVDCAMFILQEVNHLTSSACSQLYDELADHVVSAMGNSIKRPSPFGLGI